MAGIRWPPEDPELFPARTAAAAAAATAAAPAAEFVSDDDRSVAADSWSIKSEYGSTLDDEQRHVDAAEVLSSCNFRAASDYSSDKDEQDTSEFEASMLGLQSYWDAAYAEDLTNFHEHGHPGEIWFGVDVMVCVANWTKNLCTDMSLNSNAVDSISLQSESGNTLADLSSWSVLDIGTGNGLLLQELAKLGFSELTGCDYSEGAIDLARSLAIRNGFPHINFLVDDVLETKVDRKFRIIMDKGTFDAVGLHPDGSAKRLMYWESVSKLLESGGLLIITSCNTTKDELVQEVCHLRHRGYTVPGGDSTPAAPGDEPSVFQYRDNIKTYPTLTFGGVEGSRVVTVAFVRS